MSSLSVRETFPGVLTGSVFEGETGIKANSSNFNTKAALRGEAKFLFLDQWFMGEWFWGKGSAGRRKKTMREKLSGAGLSAVHHLQPDAIGGPLEQIVLHCYILLEAWDTFLCDSESVGHWP